MCISFRSRKGTEIYKITFVKKMLQPNITINGIQFNLIDLEKDCWVRLLNGSLKSRDALHNPVVANINSHGVNLRTVVLRAVDTSQKKLFFHTDIRSGKWAELGKQNQVSWLFYDAAARFQIRVGGLATLHTLDALADAAWAKSNASSRKIYMGNNAPSQITTLPVSGLPPAFEDKDPTIQESEIGRKNFGIVETTADWMEWLWLNSKGHRRASFKYKEDKSFEADWLLP